MIKGFKREEEILRSCSVSFPTSFYLSFFRGLGSFNPPTLTVHNWVILSNIVETKKIETFAHPTWNNPFPGIVSHFSLSTLQC